MIRGLKSTLGFLTILPGGMDLDTKIVARNMWLFPPVGVFIAILSAMVYKVLSLYLPNSISIAFALFALLVLTGFHHLDGLLDFGDGVMCVGNFERRRRAMYDVNIGAGGFAIGFFVLLITFAALLENDSIFRGLIVAEASAKFSMVLLAFAGKESHMGMGSAFTKTVDFRLLLITLVFYLPTLAILPLEKGMAVFIGTVAISLVMTSVSSKLFGGVSGDVFGAMNEICRMVVLVVLLL